jgi:hypothetical protein
MYSENTPSPSNNTLDAIPMEEVIWDGNMSPVEFKAIGPLKGIEVQNASSYAPTICWMGPAELAAQGRQVHGQQLISSSSTVARHPWEHPAGNKVAARPRRGAASPSSGTARRLWSRNRRGRVHEQHHHPRRRAATTT